MMTEVVIEEKNKFPISYDQFEVTIIKRKVQYQLREIRPNEIFGHQELVDFIRWEESGESGQKPTRKCKVYAKAASEVIYLNLEKFRKFFDAEQMEGIIGASYFYDYNKIKARVERLLSE